MLTLSITPPVDKGNPRVPLVRLDEKGEAWLSVRLSARFLAVSERTVKRYLQAHRLKARRFNSGRTLVSLSSLELLTGIVYKRSDDAAAAKEGEK